MTEGEKVQRGICDACSAGDKPVWKWNGWWHRDAPHSRTYTSCPTEHKQMKTPTREEVLDEMQAMGDRADPDIVLIDTRYPDALDMNETPEFETPQQEINYWKGLALSYGAKLRAVEVVMGRTWTAKFDPATESVVVIEDVAE